MRGRNKIPRALWLLFILSGFTFSAAQTLPKQVSQTDQFVSVEGGFTISLPSPPDSIQNVAPIAGKTIGGRQYFWVKPQSVLTAGFVELSKPENGKEVFETMTGALLRRTIAESGKVAAKKEFSVQGFPGLEFTIRLKTGVAVIAQYILAGSRIYTLSAAWRETESGIENLKILDSFKLIDEKTALTGDAERKTTEAKKIEESKKIKERLALTPDGKINQRYLTIFDDQGLEIEFTIFDLTEPKVYGDARYIIKYESFDAKGNWTKRTFSKLTIENGKEIYKPGFTKYRTITYYP